MTPLFRETGLSHMDSNQNLDLKDFLSECIRTLKKSHPHLSSSDLAKKFGFSTSTFNRLENRETSKTSFNNALKLVRTVCGEEKVQSFIKNHYPEMYKDFETTYPGNAELQFFSEEVEGYLKDPNTYEIMMLVSSNGTLSKELIKEEFGNRGLEIINRLLLKGILKEENQSVSIGEDRFNYQQETVQKLLLNLVEKSYYLEAFGTQTNWASVQYQSVDKEKVRPILRDIISRANAEARTALNNPANTGNDVMWVGLAYDSLFRKDVTPKNGEVVQ